MVLNSVDYFQIFLFSFSSESESSVIEDEQVEENENSVHTDEESEGEEEGSNVNEEQEESEEMEDDGQDSGLEKRDNRHTDQNGMADSTVRCVLCLLNRFIPVHTVFKLAAYSIFLFLFLQVFVKQS